MKTVYTINCDRTPCKQQLDNESEDGQSQQKLPYPRSIPFLIGCKFFERVSMNGMKTVLIIYLTSQLAFGTDEATMVYHSFHTLAFLISMFGAIVSDSWLGKYRTIYIMLITGLCGLVMLILTTVPMLYLPARELTVVALVVIALGTGCMKPCILAFGGDQFRMPEQAPQMAAFFSMVYFTLKVSAFVGTAMTPMLRNDVKCLGQDSCFLLAFGVPGILLLVALGLFVTGKCFYVVRPSSGNILVRVAKCIFHAIVVKIKCRRNKTSGKVFEAEQRHWLDCAEPKYGKQLVQDTKILLNVLVVYVPIPFYWALNEQTGSRWTLQASRMMGDLGFYEVKPDQMQIAMQVMLIVCIPLFQTVLYPLLAKIGIIRPLQKLCLAMLLAATAFVVAGFVELKLHPSYAVLPRPNESQFRFYNTFPCHLDIHTTIPGHERIALDSLAAYQTTVPINHPYDKVYDYEFHSHSDCPLDTTLPVPGHFILAGGSAVSYFINGPNISVFHDDPRKATSQRPVLRILANTGEPDLPMTMYDRNGAYLRYVRRSNDRRQYQVAPSRYILRIGNETVTRNLVLRRGRVTTLLVNSHLEGSFYDFNEVELTPPNTVHMFWMLPQYALLAMGEAILGVTGLVFAYSEAPESMKTVLQACWLLTISLGNLIDVIVIGANFIQSQANEFFMFAGIMYVNIVLFMWLARRYKPIALTVHEEKPIHPVDHCS